MNKDEINLANVTEILEDMVRLGHAKKIDDKYELTKEGVQFYHEQTGRIDSLGSLLLFKSLKK